MPVRTPHFGLEAFVLGDVYLGVIDERRFRTIDTHMAFISDLVGPGKIEGWDLSIPSSLTLKVSSGWGMIGRYITRTFGDSQKSLLDDNTIYAWMRLRPGVIGQISPFCPISSLTYQDTTAPSTPSGLSVRSRSTDSATIEWTASAEIDFDFYEIYRSNDNMTYALLNTSKSAEYLDATLKENSIYYYKIKAYDLSGNASGLSSSLLVITSQDLSKPAPPTSVRLKSSKEVIHLSWNSSAYGNILSYRAYFTPITEERIPVGATLSFDVASTFVDMTLDSLVNGQRYLIELKAVSKYGIESDGVILVGMPLDLAGPADVVEITATDYAVTSGVSTNGLTLEWMTIIDPYIGFSGTSEIQLEEYHTDGSVVTSEWIPVLQGSMIKAIEVFPYRKSGQLFYKSIDSRTTYYITIRNVDQYNQRSIGKRVKHYTQTFISPEPIVSTSIIDRIDHSLLFRWENSPSIFSSNILSIVKVNLSDSSETVLVNEANVGRSTVYLLESSYITANTRYVFRVYCVDEFGNESSIKETTFDVAALADLSRPPPPQQQVGFAGNKQNTLTWNKAGIENIKGYRIYRANDAVSIHSSDFTLLETVSPNSFTYTDYEVQNDVSYIYFITTVDSYDQESLNPRDDLYINYTLVTLKPVSNSTLDGPLNLTTNVSGRSVELSWQPTGGQFDGYEIYRSIGNKYSFTLIATTAASITYYLDSSVLTKTGTVYYMVRKFRNEADLFVTENASSVTNAIYLGKVVTKNGQATIDLTGIRKIKNLEDPIKEEAQSRIVLHKHKWYSDTDDRRINLSDKLTVDDWETIDNQTYATATDISDTTTYTILLNGDDVSTFGLLFSLDSDNGTITFETPLAPTGFETDSNQVFPFTTAPTLTIEFDNLEEVQSILPNGRIDGISAQQIGVGYFEKAQVPALSHDGRKKEALKPVTIPLFSIDDGYRYAPVDAKEPLGDAIVFYDIIQANGNLDILVASTSDGIYTSEDFGASWQRKYEPLTPVVRFFYSSRFDTYFAGTNRGILFGRGGVAGGFSIWTEVGGAENAKIIRNIVEDNNGDVFCSSDLGVFKLRRDIGQGSFFFQQTPIFGPRSTESYAILYDSLRQRLIVSNELGIFESSNSGVRWTFSSEFTEQRPIHAFIQSQGCIFAITDFMLWRRKPTDSTFQRIGVMENASIARKLVIWRDRLYVSTDSGLLCSISENDIYEDNAITFENAFSALRTNSYSLPASSLNVIDDKLFVGSEETLFISDKPGKLSLHSEFETEVNPTVYVDGEQQFIGYRFTTSTDRLRKFVCFDVKQRFGAVVSVANQYKKFVMTNGGWADTNYLSSVSLYVDGNKVNDLSLAEKPAQQISDLVLPSYNDRNAHAAGADDAKAFYEAAKTLLLEVERDDNGQITKLKGFTKGNVVATLYGIERFLSQVYESARVVSVTDSQGQVSEVPFKIPDFRVLLLSSAARTKKSNVGTFGLYKDWTQDASNSQSSTVGSFGNELTTDGILPSSLIGGVGGTGSSGGGDNVGGSISGGAKSGGG
jgi:hypothetical protein